MNVYPFACASAAPELLTSTFSFNEDQSHLIASLAILPAGQTIGRVGVAVVTAGADYGRSITQVGVYDQASGMLLASSDSDQQYMLMGVGWRWGQLEYIVPAADYDRLIWLAAVIPPFAMQPPVLAVTEQVPLDVLHPARPRSVVVANETAFPQPFRKPTVVMSSQPFVFGLAARSATPE
ncbi:hypothetical protein AB0G05_20070 [Nonomuraea wenchangensis]